MHVSWSISLFKDTTIAESDQRPPEFGDVFKVVNKKPFRKDEFYEFTLKGQSFDRSKAVSDLDNISVVPNPYVGAASWEPSTTEVGRGERLIYFMHLPSECTINIYTLSGKLVQYHRTFKYYCGWARKMGLSFKRWDGYRLWNLCFSCKCSRYR